MKSPNILLSPKIPLLQGIYPVRYLKKNNCDLLPHSIPSLQGERRIFICYSPSAAGK